jgi:hypothetical protein
MVLLARPVAQPAPDYAAMADALNKLPQLMQDARAAQNLTATAQAKQVGITSTSLTRLGPSSTTKTAAACFAWLSTRGS